MAKQQIKLGGVLIKTPLEFRIERYSITKSNRLANGNMSMELIAKKRKFICKWPTLTSAQLNKILDVIWEGNDMFFDFSYVDNNESKSATVYVGPIDTDLHRTDVVNWIWKDVQIDFIER